LEDKVGLLKELQELDFELSQIAGSSGKLEDELDQCRVERDRIQALVDDLADEMSQIDGQRKELKQSVLHEETIIARSEGRLPDIKTQKEYVAVLKEIDTAKATMRELTTKLEEFDGQYNALAEDRDGKEEELSGLQSEFDERSASINKDLADLAATKKKKDATRDKLLEKLPRAIANRYRALSRRRGGMAVVEARQGTCTGCNMNLPPQLFNILLQSNEIQSCPHCSRLLYADEGQI